jgi:glycosyltransferase involved in cell wall biosynthesis
MSLPKVSLILFSFNQEKTILEAAYSCLSQDYLGELEILFSDDSSTDNTFDIIQALKNGYQGNRHITIHKNKSNLGIGAHYNQATAMTSGELIFTAAGDDISAPNRISSIVKAWLHNEKKADLITSDLQKIHTDGSNAEKIIVADLSCWDTPEKWIRKRPYVVGAAHAFTRRLQNQFGDFNPELVYEDQVMAFRASLAGGGLKINEPLVMYREGGISQDKSNLTTSLDYLNWSKKHYRLQIAQYLQIQADLKTVRHEDLWNKKLSNKLNGASFVIALHDTINLSEKITLLLKYKKINLFFKLKHFIYIAYPDIAVTIQRIQQKLKKVFK